MDTSHRREDGDAHRRKDRDDEGDNHIRRPNHLNDFRQIIINVNGVRVYIESLGRIDAPSRPLMIRQEQNGSFFLGCPRGIIHHLNGDRHLALVLTVLNDGRKIDEAMTTWWGEARVHIKLEQINMIHEFIDRFPNQTLCVIEDGFVRFGQPLPTIHDDLKDAFPDPLSYIFLVKNVGSSSIRHVPDSLDFQGISFILKYIIQYKNGSFFVEDRRSTMTFGGNIHAIGYKASRSN